MKTINAMLFKMMVLKAGENILYNEPYLTEVDQIIGDGDHGIGMKRGFLSVQKKLAKTEYQYVDDIANDVGLELIKSMGGASGIIFGSLFIGGLRSFKKKKVTELTLNEFVCFLFAGEKAITTRGKAKIGDKTMVDALVPANESISKNASATKTVLEGLAAAYKGALSGVEDTKNIMAKLGRAKNFKDKNYGVPDPGAVSTSLMFKGFYEAALEYQTEVEELKGN